MSEGCAIYSECLQEYNQKCEITMLEGTNNFVANKCEGDGSTATAANRLHPFLTSLDP